LSASNVLRLAALFHSDNLVEQNGVSDQMAGNRCKGRAREGDYTCIKIM